LLQKSNPKQTQKKCTAIYQTTTEEKLIFANNIFLNILSLNKPSAFSELSLFFCSVLGFAFHNGNLKVFLMNKLCESLGNLWFSRDVHKKVY
jgi:hypothetical protein